MPPVLAQDPLHTPPPSPQRLRDVALTWLTERQWARTGPLDKTVKGLEILVSGIAQWVRFPWGFHIGRTAWDQKSQIPPDSAENGSDRRFLQKAESRQASGPPEGNT